MHPNSIDDIMTQAQAVLKLFVDKIALRYKMPKSEKVDNLAKYLQNFVKN